MYDLPVPLSIAPDDVLIVEGVPALLSDRLAALAQVRVHVEAPEAQRIARLWNDYAWRGETEADVDRLIASRAADETETVNRARAAADFVVEAWDPA
jgi:uridine kinase